MGARTNSHSGNGTSARGRALFVVAVFLALFWSLTRRGEFLQESRADEVGDTSSTPPSSLQIPRNAGGAKESVNNAFSNPTGATRGLDDLEQTIGLVVHPTTNVQTGEHVLEVVNPDYDRYPNLIRHDQVKEIPDAVKPEPVEPAEETTRGH